MPYLSIDERLKRLQDKTMQTKTRKGDRLEKLRVQFLEEQKGCCKCCGIRLNEFHKKYKFDFPTKKYDYPIALLCAECEIIINACGRNELTLTKVLNYISGGKKDQEAFVLPETKQVETNKPTSWSEVKPNEN